MRHICAIRFLWRALGAVNVAGWRRAPPALPASEACARRHDRNALPNEAPPPPPPSWKKPCNSCFTTIPPTQLPQAHRRSVSSASSTTNGAGAHPTSERRPMAAFSGQKSEIYSNPQETTHSHQPGVVVLAAVATVLVQCLLQQLLREAAIGTVRQRRVVRLYGLRQIAR